ncbi:DNA segregation ATPase FtsK/SpoIIIE, S-DNA-T family [Dyella sp. OK004]|uniref:DNA translocase FtsK 4TM domain-containing protein n=1 Tax=Dyella sp. OK004 TaxID=1855292 RepID=UPI0008ED86BB|nr:DNA translocase FtsK 4TM domain-containing protein [Dyella sp. OK004]SFR95735.1 DNA segregation ATPase FtsK/SpoIIIE, S-DNA-T family [Dyella sp. OK004]
MLTFFFSAFGLSTLWFIPLIWRVIRAAMAKGRQRPVGGEGTIRFWLGGLLVLLASATLEGLVVAHYTDDPTAGGVVCRALAHIFSAMFGTALSVVLMLALLVVSLRWYPGVSWRSAFAQTSAKVDLLAGLLEKIVTPLKGRFGHQRARGAVRRAGTASTTRRHAQAAARQPMAPVASAPSLSIERTSTASITSAPTMLHRPHAPVRERVIREPWLQPKNARPAPVAPSVSTARIAAAMAAATARTAPAYDTEPSVRMDAPVEIASPVHANTILDEAPISLASPESAHIDNESIDTTSIEASDKALDFMPAPQVARATAPVRGRFVAANDDEPAATVVEPVTSPSRQRASAMLPPLSLLSGAALESTLVGEAQLAETSELIEQRLREFKVPVTVVGASAGPVITRFEVEPAVGVRGNQIVALMKDLARGLGRTSIRVVETIPGKTCMGLELPNEQRQMIALSEILDSTEYRGSDSLLTLAMGKGITGEPVVADLARAPHMLVAGTTGSGKSVAVNAMILSMLYKATPDDVRMIMIDPKMLELSVYEGIPHLLAPVVTDMKLAANALAWCVAEMENRYRLMSELRVRNLAGYNQKIREAKAAALPLLNPFPAHPEIPETLDTLPMIVVVIDELADLMMVAGKKIEELIARLAQKARAAGIHLILATQRPSVDVITGLIKANIPTRVAFQVSSKIDSRTILDQMGAESLLGQGDMLFLPPGTGYPQRIHGAFVADEEVHRVVAHLKQYGEPDYKDEILAGPPSEGSGELFGEDAADAELDPLYDEAAAFVLRSRRASISSVQRQFRIGYNRAARLVEAMEAAGLVSSMGINGQRDVLAPGPAD